MSNPAAPFRDVAEREHLLTHLKLLGATKVVIEFSGSGDSGNIDGVVVKRGDDGVIDLEGQSIKWRTEAQHAGQG